jgi:hypothetical protein
MLQSPLKTKITAAKALLHRKTIFRPHDGQLTLRDADIRRSTTLFATFHRAGLSSSLIRSALG